MLEQPRQKASLPSSHGRRVSVRVTEFYDLRRTNNKNGDAQLFIPARLPEDVAEEVRKTAVRAYNLLRLATAFHPRGFLRHRKGSHRVILIRDSTTLRAFTVTNSMYPKLWEKTPVTPYSELHEKPIDCAFTRED